MNDKELATFLLSVMHDGGTISGEIVGERRDMWREARERGFLSPYERGIGRYSMAWRVTDAGRMFVVQNA